MRKSSKAFILFLICLAAAQGATAQITVSPYSHYGLGDAFNPTSTRNFAMGSTGIGSFDGTTINRINPASYADLRLTTFDFSGFGQYSMHKSNLNEGAIGTAGFHNMSMGFSNKKGYGFVFGLGPYSANSYTVTMRDSILVDTGYTAFSETYTANGGLSQFYIGAGVRFLRHFNAGVNLTYAFGTTRMRTTTSFDDDVLSPVNIDQKVTLNGFIPQAGIQYGDTLRIRREVEREKTIEEEMNALDQELKALDKAEEDLKQENEKVIQWAEEQNAVVKEIDAEKESITQELKQLMNDEVGNEKPIGKLQEKSYRLEKKRKKIVRDVKTRTRNLEDEKARIQTRREKIKERQNGLTRELEDVKAGKKPATEIRRQALILRGGAVFEPGLSLGGERLITYDNSSVTDTLSTSVAGVKLPMKYGFGFSVVRPGRWSAAADLAFTDWTRFNYFDTPQPFNSAMDLRIGGEWIPNLLSKNYGGRIAYRLGAYLNGPYMKIDGQPIGEAGVTFGVGLPMGYLSATAQNYSRINLGVGIGRRGTTEGNLLEETTFHFRVGVNLNDIWFIKRRID